MFAAEYLTFVAEAVKAKLVDQVRREKIKEYMRTLSKSRLDHYVEWLKEYGVLITGVEALPQVLALVGEDSFLRAFVGGALKLSLLLMPEVAYYFAKRYARKSAVAIETLARDVSEMSVEELGQRLRVVADAAYKILEMEDIYRNTPEVVFLARRLRQLRDEVFGAV